MIIPKLRLLNRLLQAYLNDTASPLTLKVHAPPLRSAPPCPLSQRYLLRFVCCLLQGYLNDTASSFAHKV
jgi:hypothetical protein